MIKVKVFEDSSLFFEDTYSDEKELIVGRGSQSDIVLDGHPGISRQHLKIKLNNRSASIELISSSGRLIQDGENIDSLTAEAGLNVFSVPPYNFHIEIEEEKTEQPAEESQLVEIEPPAKPKHLEPATQTEPVGFDEDEKTNVGQVSHLSYFIKVFKNDRFEEDLNIEGNKWIFGRDPKSDFVIKTKKSSRNHFSITKVGPAFYVKDLGSSNGTLLNKQLLPANQEIELKSGDYIEVEVYKFIFEMKDMNYEAKLQEIALIEEHMSEDSSSEDLSELRANALAISDEMLKLPGGSEQPVASSAPNKKTKLIRFAAIAVLAVIGAFYFIQPKKSGPSPEEVAAQARQRQIEKEKINSAVDKFNLALRFYNESQFDRCILEIDEFIKLDIQTDETAGAMDLRTQCDIEKERLQRQKDLELQQEKKRELQARVNSIIESCKPQVEHGKAVVETCLSEALNLDPSNEDIAAVIDEAQAIDLEKEQNAAKRAAYNKQVAAGQALFNKAKNYNKYGDWKRAIKTYKRFLASKYPDPKKLKAKARRNLASIQSDIDKTLQDALRDSKKHLENGDYKKSILAANEGLNVNRDDKALLETKAKADKQLKAILRKYYQESIIEEDFGQIDEAKIKWKKILELGVQGSDYFNKAKSKLKYYEEGV